MNIKSKTYKERINLKSLTVRMDDTMRKKLGVVAANEGRSKNSEIIILVRDKISEYEAQYGKIPVDDE